MIYSWYSPPPPSRTHTACGVCNMCDCIIMFLQVLSCKCHASGFCTSFQWYSFDSIIFIFIVSPVFLFPLVFAYMLVFTCSIVLTSCCTLVMTLFVWYVIIDRVCRIANAKMPLLSFSLLSSLIQWLCLTLSVQQSIPSIQREPKVVLI